MEGKSAYFFPRGKWFLYTTHHQVFPKGEVPIMKNMSILLNCLYFILESRQSRCCNCFNFKRNTLAITKQNREGCLANGSVYGH